MCMLVYNITSVVSDSTESVWVSVCVQLLSRVWLFATPWTVDHQAPLSMGFPRQEYWSGLPFPSPGDLPDPGFKPTSPALAGGFFTTEPPRSQVLITQSPGVTQGYGLPHTPTYCCAFYKIGQMYSNIYSSLWYLTEYFQCPKNPAFHLLIPSPTPAPGNINSSVSIVLPFTECHTIEHTVCTISNCLLYLSHTHLCFFHVFSSLDSSFICVCVYLCVCAQSCPTLCDPHGF